MTWGRLFELAGNGLILLIIIFCVLIALLWCLSKVLAGVDRYGWTRLIRGTALGVFYLCVVAFCLGLLFAFLALLGWGGELIGFRPETY